MNLKCQKNYANGQRRAKNAVASARYTAVFARKVVDSLSEHEVWSQVVQEFQRPKAKVPKTPTEEQAQADEDLEAPAEEVQEPEGEDNPEAARERERETEERDSETIESAETWKCPTCAELKKPHPVGDRPRWRPCPGSGKGFKWTLRIGNPLRHEEKKQFDAAKQIEVKNFVAAECFKAWQGKGLRDDEIIGMRWLLTWKFDEKYAATGGRKAKARATILGYQDPQYSSGNVGSYPYDAGRQLFLRFARGKASG